MATATELKLEIGDLVAYTQSETHYSNAIVVTYPCSPGAVTDITLGRVIGLKVPHKWPGFFPVNEIEVIGSSLKAFDSKKQLDQRFVNLLRARQIEEDPNLFYLEGDQKLLQQLEAAGLGTRIRCENGTARFESLTPSELSAQCDYQLSLLL